MAPGRHLTKVERVIVYKRFKEGVSQYVIARQLSISQSTVSKVIKQMEAEEHELLTDDLMADRMRKLGCMWDDPKQAHAEADKLLVELLKYLKYEKTIKAYKKLTK